MRRPGVACLAAAVGPLLLSSPSTPTGARDEVGSAPPAPFNLSAICPGTKYNFTATSWDHTCGDPGDGLAPPGPRCRNFSNLVPMMMVTDPHCKRSQPRSLTSRLLPTNRSCGCRAVGDNASTLVPKIIHGGAGLRCGAEAAPAGTCPAGTAALPPGLRSIRFDGVDRGMILDSDADNILPGWNASNKSWAPDAPCQPGIVAQEKGPWPGIWLDNAAWKFGSACSGRLGCQPVDSSHRR